MINPNRLQCPWIIEPHSAANSATFVNIEDQLQLDQLDSVKSLDELKIPPGNRLELLSGDRKGLYSIRINEQFRICFKWSEPGPDEVEIIDYH